MLCGPKAVFTRLYEAKLVYHGRLGILLWLFWYVRGGMLSHPHHRLPSREALSFSTIASSLLPSQNNLSIYNTSLTVSIVEFIILFTLTLPTRREPASTPPQLQESSILMILPHHTLPPPTHFRLRISFKILPYQSSSTMPIIFHTVQPFDPSSPKVYATSTPNHQSNQPIQGLS